MVLKFASSFVHFCELLLWKLWTFIIVLSIFLFSFISVSFSRRKRQKRTKERERVATFSPREKVPKEGLSIHSGLFGHLLTPIFGILQELLSVWNALCHRGSHTFAGVFCGRAQVLSFEFWGEIFVRHCTNPVCGLDFK